MAPTNTIWPNFIDAIKNNKSKHKPKPNSWSTTHGWLTKQQRGSVEKEWSLDPMFSLQFVDLLEFLGDWAYYYFPAHFIVGSNTIPPFCGDPRHWHSSRQGEWLITSPLSTADNEEHQKLCEFRNGLQNTAVPSSCSWSFCLLHSADKRIHWSEVVASADKCIRWSEVVASHVAHAGYYWKVSWKLFVVFKEDVLMF